MTGYIGINLRELINEIGEEAAKERLSDFSCPLNEDVERFLKHTAIEFSKQGIASTYLVFASFRKKYVLVGYYTLANKVFCIERKSLSSTWRKRLAKFSQYDSAIKRYTLSAPLIGQIGKNFTNHYNDLITGDELLKLALNKVVEMQMIVGGKVVYLECADTPRLIEFYSSNGFVSFGKRKLDKDEVGYGEERYLIQMLKYMK